MNNEQLKKELENKKRQSRIIQKKVAVCLAALAILCATAFGVLSIAEAGLLVEVEYIESNAYFVPHPFMDYDYNIMEDAGYLRLLQSEPLVSFSDAQSGITQTLNPEDYDNYGEAVSMLVDLVLCIQGGKYEEYYSYFTDAYRAAELEKDSNAEHPFTMQQIYGAVITKVHEEENEHSGTSTYTYRLRYKIHQNNGTFRTDIDSDSYREQELLILNSVSDPTLKINSVSTERTVVEVRNVHGWRIAAVAAGAAVIVGGVVFGTAMLLKKIGKTKKEENEA